MFNQPKNQFGSNVFGNTGSNLFGANKTTSGGLFGSSSTGFGTTSTSGFGSGTSTNLFGTPASKTATNLFGTPASQGFGSTSNTTFGSSFGQQNKAAGGLFGNTAATNSSSFSGGGSGLFGSSTGGFGQSQVANGTGAVKFTCVSGTDVLVKNGSQSNIQTRHQCITAMKEYESKSFEELHVDDRLAGRHKGGTAGTTSAFGASSTANTSFNFASTQSNTSSNLFGAQKSAFGANPSGANLFGATNTASNSSSLFSTQKPFGSTPTTSSGFGFGATPAAPAGNSLFASKPAVGGLFGSNTTTTTASSFFGSSATSTGFGGSSFGATTGGTSLFGKSAGGFGTTTTASTGFGTGFNGFNSNTAKSTASGGLFGSSTGFGTNTGSSLFSSNTAKPTFGATGGNLFGTNNTNQNKSLFSGFGNSAGTGTATSNTLGTGFNGFNSLNTNTGGNSLFGAQGTANAGAAAGALNLPSASTQQSTEILKALILSPFGDSPLFKNSIMDPDTRRKEMLKPTNPAAQKAAVQSPVYRVSTRSARPRSATKNMSSLATQGKSNSLFAGLDNDDDPLSSLSRSFIPRSNVKKLNIKLTPNSKSSYLNSSIFPHPMSAEVARATQEKQRNNDIPATPASANANKDSAAKKTSTDNGGFDDTMADLNVPRKQKDQQPSTPSAAFPPPPLATPNTPDNLALVRGRLSLEDDERSATGDAIDTESHEKHPAGLKLTGAGYYTIPSLKELAQLTDDDGTCVVENFTVGRKDYGSVSYKGKIDVTGIDFDSVVEIRRKEVTIYPDDDAKPPLGEGLNRKAEITLVNVWPTDKSTREPVTDPQRLSLMGWDSKLEQVTLKMGARFLEYRPDTGTWVFQVNHFSKYGLGDSDDEVEEPAKQKAVVPPGKAAKAPAQEAKDEKGGNNKEKTSQEKAEGVVAAKKQLWSTEGASPAVIMEMEETDEQLDVDDSVASDQFSPGSECGDMDSSFLRKDTHLNHQRSAQISFASPRLQSMRGINADKLQDAKKSLFANFDDDMSDAPEMMKVATPRPSVSRLAVNISPHSMLNDSVGVTETPSFTSNLLSTTNTPMINTDRFSSHFTAKSPVPELRRTPSTNANHLNKSMTHSMRSKVLQKQQRSTTVRPRVKLPIVSQPVRQPKIAFKVTEDADDDDDDEQRSACDSSFMLARSFRVGWGPNWTVVHSMMSTGGQEDTDSSGDKTTLNNTTSRPFTFSLQPSTQQKSPQFGIQVQRISAAPHLFIPPHVGSTGDDDMIADSDHEAVSATRACLPYLNCALSYSSLEQSNQTDGSVLNSVMSTTSITSKVLSSTAIDQSMVAQQASASSVLPLVVPDIGNDIVMDYAVLSRDDWKNLNKEHSDSGMTHLRHSVFTLCEALWGNIQLDDGSELTCNESTLLNNEHQQARKGALLAWLVDAIEADQVAGHSMSDDADDSAHQIFKFLVEGKIASAVNAALTEGNGRLAILLSQAIGNVAFRMAVGKQLTEWESMNIDQHISESMIKIYALLAAKPIWYTSYGCVNTCDELDWKRSLLTHMLFISEPVAPLDDGVKIYNKAWKGSGDYGVYCSAPLPFYEEKTRLLKCDGKKEDSTLRDICYQLVRLYCNRTHRLEKLLTTASSLPHALDHRVSWHVWRILHALGYKNQIAARNLVEMHVAYASQLETSGLWHQSVFVLMHIVDNREREMRVRNLISRHLSHSSKAEEEFITLQLGVPDEWIHETRALNAKMFGDHMTLARELLLSGHWRLGHDTLMLHIAAESLINGKYDDLKKLLEMVVIDEERVRKIPDWSVAGKIYLDYFSLCSRIEGLKQGKLSGGEFDLQVELFEDDVSSLCDRVNGLKCRNSTDRLAKSEIAKGTFDLHMTLSSLKSEVDGSELYHRQLAAGATSLERLQLPEDLALHGVLKLANTHFMSFD